MDLITECLCYVCVTMLCSHSFVGGKNDCDIIISCNYSVGRKRQPNSHNNLSRRQINETLFFLPSSFHPCTVLFLDVCGYLKWLIAFTIPRKSTGHEAIRLNRLQYNYYNVLMFFVLLLLLLFFDQIHHL